MKRVHASLIERLKNLHYFDRRHTVFREQKYSVPSSLDGAIFADYWNHYS
ncbi:hypothetical protein PAMC26577_04965 [Caballeronia sordidicola]|uniref:Uncharacterized protein n=1 Tax=Caballeronia sordidicola TaxID=196367 RepID=A0A242N429_CABSO|nr:hypothetical protein PAMC26577_04965 [Caballeronia sordidicola]